jgi:hypothetical protein
MYYLGFTIGKLAKLFRQMKADFIDGYVEAVKEKEAELPPEFLLILERLKAKR